MLKRSNQSTNVSHILQLFQRIINSHLDSQTGRGLLHLYQYFYIIGLHMFFLPQSGTRGTNKLMGKPNQQINVVALAKHN